MTIVAVLIATRLSFQPPQIVPLEERALREYVGCYEWAGGDFLYLQLWNEFTGFAKPSELVAFDESGEVRTLYPIDRDRFFAGSGAAVSATIESRVTFVRDGTGRLASLTWHREGSAPRVARRVEIEKRDEVRFQNGKIELAGTLIGPMTPGKHAAVILVHGSGAENRDYVLPWARFLARRGVAVLSYDKRGVGGSTGDWNTATFDDLASDVVAAFEYLKTRGDIDPARIGLLGISQAGWVMPLAAIRAKNVAFLISISGAGVTPAETTIDQAENDMAAVGMKPQTIADIVAVMKLQYRFAQTGEGWDEYAKARATLAERIGPPPEDRLPATPDHPAWQSMKRLFFYDPAPALRQLQVPVLALFGGLDTNIVAEKNKLAWERALREGGNRDYTLVVLQGANHLQLEAKTGSNAEMPSLQRFVPAYFTTVEAWLAKRLKAPQH